MQTPPRILIVDDMVDIRLMMSQYLAHHGYQTTTANDGRDALDQIALMWPDLMLVDLWMPRMNGGHDPKIWSKNEVRITFTERGPE